MKIVAQLLATATKRRLSGFVKENPRHPGASGRFCA
jgi:hypothetical protein